MWDNGGMHRISPFSSKTGLLAWFFVAESVLGYLHLGEFSMHLGEYVFCWIQAHFFWDLGIGLGLLFMLNQWDKIEPSIPLWMRYTTVHDHLHVLSEHHNVISTRIASIEEWRTGTTAINVDNISRIESLEHNSAEHQKRVGRAYGIITELPILNRYLFDVNRLVWDIERSIETFRIIRNMYGDLSPVVRRPFSDWRLPSHSIDAPADDSIRDGERWARYLESYIERAQGFRHGWYGDFFLDKGLFFLVGHWYTNHNETSADELETLMLAHRLYLIEMRRAYAATFIEERLKETSS
jgi:hypothetical protein